MVVAPEMLVMLPQCDHSMKLNRQSSPVLVGNPLQLFSIQDALSFLAIAVEVVRKRQGMATFSIIKEKEVGFG